MNISPRLENRFNGDRVGLFATAALAGFLAIASPIRAQQVTAPAGTTQSLGTTASVDQRANLSSTSASQASAPAASPSPLQWGPITMRPHALYRFLYATGLQARPGYAVNTVIQSLSPGILAEFGTHWSFDYTPTWNVYSSDAFRDVWDHSALLDWKTSYEGWALNASQSFTRTTSALVETATQTRETDYSTIIEASYPLNSQLATQTLLNQSFRFAEGFTDTREWTVLEYLHYKVASDLDAAAGLKYGFVKVSTGSDTSFVQVLGRIAWRPAGPITLELQGGLENRRTQGADSTKTTNPIFGVSIQYKPTDSMLLSVNAQRAVSASYFANEFVESTSLIALADERLIGRLHLSAGATFQNSKYRASVHSVASGRTDNTYVFSTRLNSVILRSVTAAVFYQYSNNSSNRPGFDYSSNQVGIELGRQF